MSEPARTPVAVVSGATGFLGSAICAHLAAHGYDVRGLARDPAAARVREPGRAWFRCSLPDDVDAAAFAGASLLIHCAWETRFRDEERARQVNVEGSRRLFAACRAAGGRIVFVSSLSAHPEAVSVYGRTKLEVEALLDPARDVVVAPGTVVGEGGVFWRQAQSIARLPFIPLFFGGRQRYQTVALADLCEAIARIADRQLTGKYRVAEPEPVSVREVWGAVAEAIGRRPRYLPLPGGLALVGLRILERFGFQLPLSSDNLLGLKRLCAFDLEEDLRDLGFRPRPMRQSLAGIRWNRVFSS